MENLTTRLQKILRLTTNLRSLRPSQMNYKQAEKFAQYNRLIHELSNRVDNGFYSLNESK